MKKIIIFHIYRKDGSSLFLHPFEDSEVLLKLDTSTKIEGKYGMEPRVESFTMLRNRLYRLIEASVKEWVQDVKFIPRFIISSGVFLFVYFFTSLVIRDPIPVIDELAASIAASVGIYFFLSKRDQSSEKASKKRLDLRTAVDRIVFTESAFVSRFEKLLHENESLEAGELVKSMLSSGNFALDNTDAEELKVLLGYLDKIFSSKVYRKQERKIHGSNIARSVQWARSNKIDLSLFALYRKIKTTSLPDL